MISMAMGLVAMHSNMADIHNNVGLQASLGSPPTMKTDV
jgi:hypothetical protein